MIAGASNGYAQTGFMKYADATTKNFAEYSGGSSFYRVFGSANLCQSLEWGSISLLAALLDELPPT